MKYYQNKQTNEIIGITNMRELITHPTEQSIRAGFKGYSYKVIYDMVCPNKFLGNGIVTYNITHGYLSTNYKRIKMQIALDKYPKFNQYRHSDLIREGKKLGIDTLEILHNQKF